MKQENTKATFSDSKAVGKATNGSSNNLNNTSYSKANITTTFLNSTQLKNISNSEPIEVSPSEVYFRDIEINQTYEITVYVRNLTKKVRRMRIFQPQTARFRCDYDMKGAIAAGLAMKLVISFETNALGEFSDFLKIVSEDNFHYDIPLHAYPPTSQIIFEPFINLGFVRINKEKSDLIYFKNEGKSDGKVELVAIGCEELKIDPFFFTIAPGKTSSSKITYNPREAGIFRGVIEVKVNGQAFQKDIHVNATSVEYNRFLIDENGSQTSSIDFGSMYFGQPKEMDTYLVNNTPKTLRFRTNFRLGLYQADGVLRSLQTPSQVGFEQTEKIMSVHPSEGVIDSYSQIPLKFRCKSKVSDDNVIWTRNYCISKEEKEVSVIDYAYSAMIEFVGEENDPTVIHLVGKGQCPVVKVGRTIFQFGECPMNDRRDIEIILENRNEELPIDFSFQQTPCFTMTPLLGNIPPKEQIKFIASFVPKSLGKFSVDTELNLLKNNFRVPMKLYGTSSTIHEKKKKYRGIESLPEDYEEEKTFIEPDKFEIYTKKKRMDRLIFSTAFSTESISNLMNMYEKSNTSDKLEDLIIKQQNKKKYNDLLKTSRMDRINKDKKQMLNEKLSQMNEKLKELGIVEAIQPSKEDEDSKPEPPVDYEFQFGLGKKGLDSPRQSLPEYKDSLYVLKPIDKYEPVAISETKAFNPDPNAKFKKKLNKEPKSHAEIRDCHADLSSEMLQKIFAGPSTIDFGRIFTKSTASKTFQVRNDLRSSILVKLVVENPELQQSTLDPQVIPSTQTAGFDVVFYTTVPLLSFRGYVKYIINEKYQFEFMVSAQVEPVQLEIPKPSQNLVFKFAEDNQEMSQTEKIKIYNNGNAKGRFDWLYSENKIFIVEPKSGEVEPGTALEVAITYSPSGNVNGPKGEEDKLILKVKDGVDVTVKCVGYVNETKCVIRESLIDFKEICVCTSVQQNFNLKNLVRSSAIFRVNKASLPEGMEITPPKGKIFNEDSKSLTVSFSSKVEGVFKGDIQIDLRGGKPLKLPYTVSCIIPQVKVEEEEFDFGEIRIQGNSAILPMTVTNESGIKAILILDLRERDDMPKAWYGVECIDVQRIKEENEEEEECMVPIEGDTLVDMAAATQKPSKPETKDPLEDDKSSEYSSDEEKENKSSARFFKITVNPGRTLKFNLSFSPRECKNYNLEVPLTLAGYQGRLENLARPIICVGSRPRFLMDPQTIEFKKKIITTVDKCFPTMIDIKINNPDTASIKWKVEMSQDPNAKPFAIIPSEGEIKGGEILLIKASFNPFSPGNYWAKLPLYIDNNKKFSYLEIEMKGIAAFPRLIFDRAEIILPVVPLEISAKCAFRIINDGYENLTLKHKIPNEIGSLNLEVVYLDGKNLGVTRSKLRMEVKFQCKRPISFTTRIEFSDDNDRTYTIAVSGTTENCLFTNFSFLQRMSDEFKMVVEEGKPIKLIEDYNDEDSVTDKSPNPLGVMNLSKAGSMISSKSSKSMLGYTPIPKIFIDQNIQNVLKWLNYYALVSSITSFPNDIINSNGSQVFELIAYLTNKNLNCKAKLEGISRRSERINLVVKQYEELIKILKENGAYLNTIRPHYLLSYGDFLAYMKMNESDSSGHRYSRVSEQRFSYISNDAWVTLVYQILKIYLLSRINIKSFKLMQTIPPEKLAVPDYYLEGSNIFSQQEGLLLRWMEVNYENVFPLQSRRFTNFEKDIRDCLAFSALIQSYVNTQSVRGMLNLKQNCVTDEDFIWNASKIVECLGNIGLQTPYSAIDISKPSQRAMLLFIIQLYNTLPHYIPKGSPIIFSCVLGEEVIKTIELKNDTKKPVSYWVKYEGHSDFSTETETVKIDPGKKEDFKVHFQSRISNPVTGRLIFTNKREGNVQAAALVFDLKSNITERRSVESWSTKSNLYQCEEFKIQVKNIFTGNSGPDYAEFSIKLVMEPKPVPVDTKRKKTKVPKDQLNKSIDKSAAGGKKPAPNASLPKEEEKPYEIPPFFIGKEKIRLRRGEVQPLVVQFLPFTLEKHRCQLIFTDPNVGEFQHEIEGETLLPESIETFRPGTTVYVDIPNSIEPMMSLKNEHLANAKKLHENRLISYGKLKERDAYMKSKVERQPESVTFDIEVFQTGTFVNIPNSFTVSDAFRLSKKDKRESMISRGPSSKDLNQVNPKNEASEKIEKRKKSLVPTDISDAGGPQQSFDPNTNRLPIGLHFKYPVRDYTVNFTMRSQDRLDIRTFKVVVSANPKIVRATIEMKVSAGEEIKQDIPLINNSDKNWTIKATLVPDPQKNGNFFSGAKDFFVEKSKTGFYSLYFRPTFIADSEAKLTLQNPATNDVFEYELFGKGEEPLAKDHLVINCIARKTTKREIELFNNNKEKVLNYIVETDLLNAEGPSSFSIQGGKSYRYPLSITPNLGGVYTGSITFFDKEDRNKYIWYTISVNTERPRSEKIVDLQAFVRRAVVFEISLNNPLSESATFEVLIEGEGLVGDSLFLVPAKQTATYEILFSPLRSGKWRGSVAFINEVLGEIWYELRLISEENPVVRMPTLKAELGKVEWHEVELENPSGKEVEVNYELTNPQNFDVYPEKIKIPSYDSVRVRIRYTPSDLDVNETGEVTFHSTEIGKWQYLLFGTGLPPTKFDNKVLSCPLSRDISSTINFKNPFKEQITVLVTMESDKDKNDGVFQLLLKKSKTVVPGLTIFQIPFSFTPKEISEYFCEIQVFMNEKIKWRYPIKGVTESVSNTVTFNFKTKAREILNKEMKVYLPGLPAEALDQKFDFSFIDIPPEFEGVMRGFLVKPVKNTLKFPEDCLIYNVQFKPMKPFKTLLEFAISKSTGGRWKYKLFLEATEPDEDDVIVIYSPLNKTSSVSFKLTNRFRTYAPFTAYFLPFSDPEFSVMPKSGQLEQYGREGTNFIVSFTPIEYGKLKKGKLIIETDELYWSYSVKGTFPQYKPPENVPFSINNKLEPSLIAQRNSPPRNYMVDNIKKAKQSSPPRDERLDKRENSMMLNASMKDRQNKSKSLSKNSQNLSTLNVSKKI